MVTMQHIPIRKLYWDSFIVVLNQATQKLAKDISASIGKDEEPLLKAIKDKMVDVYFFDEPETWSVDIAQMRCTTLVQSPETPTILIPCNNPILWSSTPGTNHKVCVEHTLNPLSYSPLPEWNYLKIEDETLLLNGNYLYTQEMVLIGRYCPTKNCVTKFIVERD